MSLLPEPTLLALIQQTRTHRTFTTTPRPHNQPPPPPDTRPSRQPGGSHEKHRLFYREFYPPLIRCFAYGTGAYFALHLTWQYLDSKEQDFLRDEERSALEYRVKELREGVKDVGQSVEDKVKDVGGAAQEQGSKKSWWKFW